MLRNGWYRVKLCASDNHPVAISLPSLCFRMMVRFAPHPRFHWFAYHAPTWETKAQYRRDDGSDIPRILHQIRDGAAFVEISQWLASIGSSYVGPILNLPLDWFPKGVKSGRNEGLRPGDLIVQVTRPPLSDQRKARTHTRGIPQPATRKFGRVVSRSETELEKALHKAIRGGFLDHCSRDRVELCESMADRLDAEYPNLTAFSNVPFRTNINACFPRKWSKMQPLLREFCNPTAGYLIYIPSLEKPFAGISALIIWAQSGFDSLFWAWALRHVFSKELRNVVQFRKKQRFVMAVWDMPQMASRPTDLRAFKCCAENAKVLFRLTE